MSPWWSVSISRAISHLLHNLPRFFQIPCRSFQVRNSIALSMAQRMYSDLNIRSFSSVPQYPDAPCAASCYHEKGCRNLFLLQKIRVIYSYILYPDRHQMSGTKPFLLGIALCLLSDNPVVFQQIRRNHTISQVLRHRPVPAFAVFGIFIMPSSSLP